MKFITRVMLIVGLIFGTAMSAAPAGAVELAASASTAVTVEEEKQVEVPLHLYPTLTVGTEGCTVNVPEGDIVSWTPDYEVYYQGATLPLAFGESVTLHAFATAVTLVPTSVTFTCEGEDPDPDLAERPGKGKGGPPKGVCDDRASDRARESVPGWLCVP